MTKAPSSPSANGRARSGAAAGAGKVSSLSDQAYDAIKEKIVTLFFVPGQYLNEGAICELLQMGRTPVHQALLRLQVEGLVEIIPRKGIVVQPDSLSQIVEVLDARAVVEAELARRAAENATEDEVAGLERILKGAPRRHGGGAIDAFIESDRAFHVAIAAMAKNRVLAEMAKTLHERSTRAWYLHLWQTLDLKATGRQHAAICEAIRARDGTAAAEAICAHIGSLRERYVHILNSSPLRHHAVLRP